MQLDYELRVGLEEWVGGAYRVTHDFYRLIIFTDEMQKKLWHYFGKMVVLGGVVMLTKEEFEAIHTMLANSHEFTGLYGSYRVNAFTPDTFYGDEDAVATGDELSYEYEWADL
jgi:hypothetical protein